MTRTGDAEHGLPSLQCAISAGNSVFQEEHKMSDARRRYLQIAMVAFGLALMCVYPLMKLWPSGWAWHPAQHEYEQMIVGIYATLGIFLVWASRKPEDHISLIWFTVWSSVVHGGIMAVQALTEADEMGHLPGDVAALLLIAIVLAVLAPKRA
jgi:hypothetical protein